MASPKSPRAKVSFNDLSMTKMARLMRRIRAHPYHVVTILLVFLILIKIKGDVGRHLGVRSYGSNGGASGIPASTGNATLDCFNRFDIEKILSMYTTADYDSEIEEIPPDANVEKICKQFELDGTRPRKYWHDIIKTDMGDLNQITFVTQLTPDRLERLRKVAETWSGPMAANFYVAPKKIAEFMNAYCTDPVLQLRKNIQLHITQTEGLFYPSNIMRNIAVEPVKTNYVFLCDVDFIPIPNIESIMQRYIRDGYVSDDKLIVIPAFEIKDKDVAHPKSKREVLDLLDKEKIQLMDIDHFDGAHKWTNLTWWKQTNEPYIVQWREYFEPYVVMPKDKTPKYNPRFVGRIRDKITHLMIVSATGFKFHIVPDAYTVHMPHADKGMQSWDKAGLYAKCAIALYDNYKAELEQKYNVKFT